MYQDLFDENHKMIAFTPAERARGEGYSKYPSSGEYEGGLLCEDCDNGIIGEYETYASKALYGGLLPGHECPVFKNCKTQEDLCFINLSNINYKKIKLFYLSILWRSSISTRPFFNEIKLDNNENEALRKMILNGDPGAVDDFPIFFMTLITDKQAPKDFIAQPQKRITSGHSTYVFIIAGMFYFFYINSKDLEMPKAIVSETIKPTNEMNVYHVPDGKGLELIFKFYGLKLPLKD